MKQISAILVIAMIIAFLASCSSSEGSVKSDTASANEFEATAAESAEAVTEEQRLPLNLPEKDLEGYVFTAFYAEDGGGSSFDEAGVYAENLNGEIINDIVYERNQRISEKYNCTFTHALPGSDLLAELKKAITAGDDLYSIALRGAYHFASIATSNMLCDLNSLEYLDFSQPWWNNTLNNQVSVGGRLYFTLGSFMLNAKINLYHIIFNKKIANDYAISPKELYDDVRSNTWVLDDYAAMIKGVKKDLNGDGLYDYNDLWGCGAESYNAYTLALGAGAEFVAKDADDIPYVSANEEVTINILSKVLDIFADKDNMLVTENVKGVDDIWTNYSDMLVTGKLFTTLGSLRSYCRTMEDDYGVLPMPKFTEKQEHYYHTTTVYNAPVMAIPITCAASDKVAFICEAMAYESYYELMPAFYDNYLNTKMLRDTDSVEMLKIIHDSMCFELSALYILDKFVSPLNSTACQQKTDIASTIAKSLTSATTALDKVTATIIEQ